MQFLTPLVDREVFFGNPEISGAQISPDGEQIAFIKPLNGIMSDREIFDALDLGDPWTDAGLPTLFMYLMGSRTLVIPDSWHGPMMRLKAQLEDFVTRLP